MTALRLLAPPAPAAAASPQELLLGEIASLERKLAEARGRLADTADVTRAQRDILEALAERPDASEREIAAHIGVSKTAINKVCLRLEEKGLVHRRGEPGRFRWVIGGAP